MSIVTFGLLLINFYRDHREQRVRHDVRAATLLDEALDLLGGSAGLPHPGTTSILMGSVVDPQQRELARRKIDEVLLFDRDNTDALYLSGMVAVEAGRLGKAAEISHDFIRAHPDNAKAHSLRGIVLMLQRKPDEGIAELELAVALAPNTARMHTQLGTFLVLQDRLDEASHELMTAIGIAPRESTIHNSLGLLYLKQGKFREAAAQLRVSVALEPTVAMTHNNLGVALMNLDKTDEAATEFRAAFQLDMNLDMALSNLGIMLVNEGELDKGIAELRRAVQLNPSASADVRERLVDALTEAGRVDEANEARSRFLERDSDATTLPHEPLR